MVLEHRPDLGPTRDRAVPASTGEVLPAHRLRPSRDRALGRCCRIATPRRDDGRHPRRDGCLRLRASLRDRRYRRRVARMPVRRYAPGTNARARVDPRTSALRVVPGLPVGRNPGAVPGRNRTHRGGVGHRRVRALVPSRDSVRGRSRVHRPNRQIPPPQHDAAVGDAAELNVDRDGRHGCARRGPRPGAGSRT